MTAVVLDQPEAVRLRPGDGAAPSVPAYAYPEAAARTLARAARYGTWRSRPPGTVLEFTDVRAGLARSIVASGFPVPVRPEPGRAGGRWRMAPHTRMSLAASARMSLPGTAPKWSSRMRL